MRTLSRPYDNETSSVVKISYGTNSLLISVPKNLFYGHFLITVLIIDHFISAGICKLQLQEALQRDIQWQWCLTASVEMLSSTVSASTAPATVLLGRQDCSQGINFSKFSFHVRWRKCKETFYGGSKICLDNRRHFPDPRLSIYSGPQLVALSHELVLCRFA